MLVRDFVHAALYDPKHGYFSQRSGSVGVLERSIKFHQLEGRKAYMKQLDKIYKQSGISWFTPVELFKPWYAQGIAEAIMRTANLSVPLKIYEIGGGSGTCAKGIMDYIMLNAPPRVYNSMTYTSVEISPALAEIQKQTVGEVRSHLSKFKVERRDATDRSGWGDVEQQPCWVIMLEVLDNLPHDLIYSENQVSPWLEVWVEKQLGREGLSEVYRPLQDPLIKSCLEVLEVAQTDTSKKSLVSKAWSKLFPKPRRCWLPTGCMKLLEVLHAALPKMSLIASDFSYLPDVKIPGDRAPLVSTKKDGHSSDYSNYLDAKGDADIFFPTDFWLLENIDHYCSGWLKLQKDKSSKDSKQGKKRRTITLDTSSFMEEFGLPSKTRTKDGYNPLLDDFKNTKFYLSVPTHNIK
ncbi:putative S-adenosyl-L-methionine-dependent methyltransferase MidA protein [Corchorus capsularis]|uniref:Protein arginine methyltransferase NDUFAF7 n=1 Tax=Corchorus capsularis TaxID=210143 RepID=A0A1R3JDX8_COCAP|nr:putative S-adenosyl-L-methionine-dependent methyltransferase MidA protein [Corchorus capsularis]